MSLGEGGGHIGWKQISFPPNVLDHDSFFPPPPVPINELSVFTQLAAQGLIYLSSKRTRLK